MVIHVSSPTINPSSPAPAENPITKRVCEEVFQAVHKDMRGLLDFHTIYPLLNARHLLRPGLDQAILTTPTITHERRIDVLISWLPKCGLSDYLTPFVESLMESSDQAGDAHKELAAVIEQKLKEIQRMQNEYPTGDDSLNWAPDDHNRTHLADENCRLLPNGKGEKRCPSLTLTKCKFAVILLVLFVTGTWIVCTVLFIDVLPNAELALATGTQVERNSTLTLTSNPTFLEEITMQFLDINGKDCTESSHSFDDDDVPSVLLFNVECSDLPLKNVVRPENNTQQEFMFALPGSHITFTVPDNDSYAVNESWPHVWVTGSHEINVDLKAKLHSTGGCQHYYRCEDFPGVCYASEDYVGRSIVYNISQEGYYNYFLSPRDDCSTQATHTNTSITWNYNVTQYDIKSIKEKSIYKHVRLDSPITSLSLSGFFEFGRKSCALLDLPGESVKSVNYSCVKISVKGPWDVAVLVLALYVLLLTCVLIGTFMHYWRFNKKRSEDSTV